MRALAVGAWGVARLGQRRWFILDAFHASPHHTHRASVTEEELIDVELISYRL